MSEFINGDCLEYMRQMPDNAFELAIVDPPYGDALHTSNECSDAKEWSRFGQRFDKYKRAPEEWGQSVARTGGTWAAKYGKKIIAWDSAPSPEYFEELFRVSQNQIIWGGNYFDLPPTRCFVVWRKTNIPLKGFTMAPVEYAWTSFNQNAVCIEAGSQGSPTDPRFHPTQKPVALYEELLMRFANKGDKILDTHVGSGSSLVACYNMGYEYTGYEIDIVYYRLAKHRLEESAAQIRMDI